MAELWVGSLRADVTARDVIDVFSSFGPVGDAIVHSSSIRPYAFVRFRQQPHAAAAAAELTGAAVPELTDTHLEVRWSNQSTKGPRPQQKQQQVRQQQATSEPSSPEVWVGSLLPGIPATAVRRHFEQLTVVTKTEVSRGPAGRDFAFVGCADADAASLLIAQLDGAVVPELTGTLPLSVKPARRHQKQGEAEAAPVPPHDGAAAPAHAAASGAQSGADVSPDAPRKIRGFLVGDALGPSRVLWIGNIGGQATASQLASLFGRFGTVESCSLFPAPGFNNEYQYAFIQMAATHHAALALQELNALETLDICSDKRLKIRFALPAPGGKDMNKHRGGWVNGPAAEAGGERKAPAAAMSMAQEHRQQRQQQTVEEQEAVQGPGASQQSSSQQPEQPATPAPARCCVQCGATGGKLLRCTGCLAVHYCNKECQTADWPRHGLDCAHVKALSGALAAHPASAALLLEALRHPGSKTARMVEAAVAHVAATAEGAPASLS